MADGSWEVLGVEPVPGSPEGVRALVDRLRSSGVEAQGVVDGLLDLSFGVGGTGWTGSAAGAFTAACGVVTPEVSVLVDGARDAAAALDGFAGVMEVMQQRAEGLRDQAVAAEADRTAQEDLVEELTARVAALELDHEVARSELAATRESAAVLVAAGDLSGLVVDADADALQVAVNDALAALQTAQAELAAAEAARADAQQRLDHVRADAQLLAEDFESEAVATAAAITPIAPYGLDVFQPVGGGGGGLPPVPPPPAPPPVVGGGTGGGGPRPPVAPPGPPAAPPRPTVPAEPPWETPGRAASPLDGASIVAMGSMLSAARLTGAPAAVGAVVPDVAVFDEYRRYGLQPVAARGAAIARALGFDGVIGGMGTRAWGRSDHSVGLAIDLMTYDDTVTGDALAQFFWTHREELGLTYIIWDGRIASASRGWEWRTYSHPAGRTDPTAMHLDHVHVSFDPDENPYAMACCGYTL